jgi:hypothetical protein
MSLKLLKPTFGKIAFLIGCTIMWLYVSSIFFSICIVPAILGPGEVPEIPCKHFLVPLSWAILRGFPWSRETPPNELPLIQNSIFILFFPSPLWIFDLTLWYLLACLIARIFKVS